MENFKFYVLHGNKQEYVREPKFELRKIITLEVKKGKLKIDKDLSLDFIEAEKIENFMYNLKFSSNHNKTTFKGFLNKEELESYIIHQVEFERTMIDLRR